jgi:type I restriction enzyme S subunit
VAAGDVLFSTVRVYLENIALVPPELDGAVASTAFAALRPGAAIEPRFLYHVVTSKPFIQAVTSLQRGNSPPSVQEGDVRGQRIPLPPKAEQQRIVSRIEELFSEIDEGERALERVGQLVERYRQSVLKAAVTGELTREWRLKTTGEDSSTPNELPAGWKWMRAEEVCGFITKGTTPPASAMRSDEGAIPFIKVYNLTLDGSLNFSLDPTYVDDATHRGALARSIVRPGDVLMNIVGPPLGKVSIVPPLHREWNMNQAVCVFRPLDGLNREFLAYFLLSRVAQDWLASKAKASVGQVNLTLQICRDLPVPMPPLAEQQEIAQVVAAKLARLDNMAASLRAEVARATALRQSILKAAFSGQLVPQDPRDEPASALLARLAAQAADAPTAAHRRGRSAGRRPTSPNPEPVD